MIGDVYAHPTAIIETDRIGDGTRIWPFTHIMPDVTIGMDCNIGSHCFIESGAVIGNNVTIKNVNMIWRGVVLQDGVFVGPNVTFTNDLYPRSARLPQARRRYLDRGWLAPTLVKQGASIGAGAVVLSNLTIHEFAMIGAGATVTRDIAPYALVIGSPARLSGWVCECGKRLVFRERSAVCAHCKRRFAQRGGGVEITDETSGAL